MIRDVLRDPRGADLMASGIAVFDLPLGGAATPYRALGDALSIAGFSALIAALAALARLPGFYGCRGGASSPGPSQGTA